MDIKRTLVFMGDSLTEFFDWQKRFPGYEVFNFGLAGETVEGLTGRVDIMLRTLRSAGREPDLIFLMTGINNIAMEDNDILPAYRQAVGAIAAAFTKSRMVIQSILPVTLPWVDNGIIEELNASLRLIANEFGAEYIDLYNLFVRAGSGLRRECLLDDGVHISGKGYEVWAGAVEDFLKRLTLQA
ncbi:MAG: GDSL family lipase [Nitrospirae bacterium]|nr:GDSL family lipase [Nitrospirota bacterium]